MQFGFCHKNIVNGANKLNIPTYQARCLVIFYCAFTIRSLPSCKINVIKVIEDIGKNHCFILFFYKYKADKHIETETQK